MRKFFIGLGAASIIASSSISMAFSDVVENHWAKDAINSMVDKGIISGYTDGTFRPSRNISKIESLILLSKIAGVNKYSEQATKYEDQYKNDLAGYTTDYKKQVAYLLGTGVLKKDDLPDLLSADKINSAVTREEMAVLIAKIMGKEEEVNKNSVFVVPPFEDFTSVTAVRKPYVAFVYNEGIMKGVTDTKFSPKTYVTRAQAAIILDFIIDDVNIVPQITKPDTTTTTTTTPNTNVDTTKVSISITKGEIKLVDTILRTIEIEDDIFEYDENTKFYIDGKSADELDIFEGMDVIEAIIKSGKLTSLNVNNNDIVIDDTTGTVTGEISSINISTDKIITLKVKDKEKSYYISSKTDYYIDGEEASLYDFEIGEEVTLTVDEGYANKMVAGEEKEEISDGYRIGKITAIYEDDEKIKIKLNDGTVQTIYLASTYKIIDSDGASTKKLSKLAKGDYVIAVGEYMSKKYTASVIVIYYE